MNGPLHITDGDHAAGLLAQSGLAGDVLAWRDVLYDAPRHAGWPSHDAMAERAAALAAGTGGALARETILDGLQKQYRALADAVNQRPIVLWFDACLFDQSMLAHILSCLAERDARDVELLAVDAFPGIEPFHGLGQLTAAQLAALYDHSGHSGRSGRRQAVTAAQWQFAIQVERAFATQDAVQLAAIASRSDAPLPWVPAAAARWLLEQPDPLTGLGRLETLALTAVRNGCETPAQVFAHVAAADTPPQYWGDTTLWAKINGLADRQPPLVTIEGHATRLPQWGSGSSLADFIIRPSAVADAFGVS